MNKKIWIIVILALVLVPIAAAQLSESIKNALGFIFDVTENLDLVWIKAGIWFIAFYFIFRSAERILPQSRGAAAIISLIISIIGIRYMPDEWIEWMGTGAMIIIIIGFPYFVGNLAGSVFRLGRSGKTFLILVLYAASVYGLTKLKVLPVETEALGALGLALEWFLEHNVITLIIIVILCAIFIFKGGIINWGGREPRVLPALGRGAKGLGGLAGKGAAAGAAQAKGWFARRRQKARLAAGWKQAEQKYGQKIKEGYRTGQFRGAKIKKGTQGYEQLRRYQIRLAKARKRRGKKPGFKI